MVRTERLFHDSTIESDAELVTSGNLIYTCKMVFALTSINRSACDFDDLRKTDV